MGGCMCQWFFIFKGVVGLGKMMIVWLLVVDMGCEFLEWKNFSGYMGMGFVLVLVQFDDFLG